jgi:DNA polymerase-4
MKPLNHGKGVQPASGVAVAQPYGRLRHLEARIAFGAAYHVCVMRWILHADLDAFYASVEVLDNPELAGKPVVVGGPPEARAVVTTASYEARVFGVRSAMPMSRALRLCPQAIRVSPRFDRYGDVSREVMAVFRALTPLVEPLSLDEAFLDVSERVSRYQGVEAIARRLKADVKARTKLTVSIGAGTNKTVAKIASDMQKPDGMVVVPPGGEASFLAPLPVRALPGVGPRAEEALKAAGVLTIGQLAEAPPGQMESLFGSRGSWLAEVARGIDERPIEMDHERKSVGAETTFPRDLADGPELRDDLRRVALDAARRLASSGMRARTVMLKLRYRNFHTITRQQSAPEPTDDAEEIVARAGALLDAVVREEDKFRLIGVSCANLVEPEKAQMGLWEEGGGRTDGEEDD